MNTLNNLVTDGGQNKNSNTIEGTFYCENFIIKVKALSGMGEDCYGFVQDFNTESKPRFKFYFDTINSTTSGKQINLNEELNASFSIKIK